MWSVYAISSVKQDYIYVGMTSDLADRLKRHNGGGERTTRPYRPFVVLYSASFESRDEARMKEKYLKSGCGKEFLKAVLRMRFNEAVRSSSQ